MPDVFVAPDENKDTNASIRQRMRLSQISDNVLPSFEKEKSKDFVMQDDSVKIPEQTMDKSQNSTQGKTEVRNAMPLFASFWQYPHNIYFDTQEPDEEILLFIRRHFITNVPWIVFTILLLILPPLLTYLLHIINYNPVFLPLPLMTALVIMYYAFVLTYTFASFLDWFFNISLITTKRVLDIQLKDLIYKKVAATKISLVQDVSYQQAGTIRSIFNYGDVLIQTAGTLENFVIEAAPEPETVVQIVESIIGNAEQAETGGNAHATI